MESPGAPRARRRTGWRHYLPEILIAAILGGASVNTLVEFYLLGYTPYLTIGWDIATLASVSLFFTMRYSDRHPGRFLRELVVLGTIVALVSVFTGLGNGATDEGYTTPYYAQMMFDHLNPYTNLAILHYTVTIGPFYAHAVTSTSYDTYLPLISFVQIPGSGIVGYELLGVAAWLGMVYLVRRDEFAAITLASPVIALLASNGFNDLPLLFLMTLSLRGWTGPKAKAVEYLTYGMKQFANAFWLVYYIARREWLSTALVVIISIVWIVPFLLWSPASGIWCNAATLGLAPGCSSLYGAGRGLADLWDHWNYYVWPVWIYALFRPTIDRWLLRLARWLGVVPAAAHPAP